MSARPDTRLRATLHAAPSAARLAPGDLESARERLDECRLAAARDEGRRQAMEGAAGALEQAVEQLEAAGEKAAAELAGAGVQLAVEIARELLQREIDAGRYDLERIVREALAVAGVTRGQRVVVHVNPGDAERLAGVTFRSGTEIVADAEVPCGDVHVSTPHGVLVRDVDHALASIAERLREHLT